MLDPTTDQSPGLVENNVMLTELRQQNLPLLVLLVNFTVPSSNALYVVATLEVIKAIRDLEMLNLNEAMLVVTGFYAREVEASIEDARKGWRWVARLWRWWRRLCH